MPNRFDTFLLGEGEKKVTEEADTRKAHLEFIWEHYPYPCSYTVFVTLVLRFQSFYVFHRDSLLISLHVQATLLTHLLHSGIPSASTFTFNKEDHTLGNLLRSHLLKSPHVRFSGYKVPHPLNRQVFP